MPLLPPLTSSVCMLDTNKSTNRRHPCLSLYPLCGDGVQRRRMCLFAFSWLPTSVYLLFNICITIHSQPELSMNAESTNDLICMQEESWSVIWRFINVKNELAKLNISINGHYALHKVAFECRNSQLLTSNAWVIWTKMGRQWPCNAMSKTISRVSSLI